MVFLKRKETVLNQINREIEALEADPELEELEAVLNEERKLHVEDRIQERNRIKTEIKRGANKSRRSGRTTFARTIKCPTTNSFWRA
ncbi:MAG: hypothetical protein R2792_05790 [Saprospiraceae bacterium]